MKRILLVHHPGNAFNNPTLQSFIQYSISNSIKIDIRCKSSIVPKPEIKNLSWLQYGRIYSKVKNYYLKRKSSKTVIRMLALYEALFVFKKKYDLIIGVDREGLIDAGHYSKIFKVPYVYFSFEIMFADETGAHIKKLERQYSKDLSLWMVQDEIRANCLIEENNLSMSNCFLCPIASAGIGELNPSRLRDSLGINGKKKVAIFIGSLTDWSMADEIIQSVEKWPEDWVLIVHERYGRTSQILKEKVKEKLLGTRIVFSNSNTASLDDMGTILAGIDLGVAFYKPLYTSRYNGKNIKYLGLASGKIATYLRYGIPIITNNIGKYADIVKRNHLGIVLEDPKNIGSVLGNINKSEYSDNCNKYFMENLDANLYIPPLFNKLISIMK